MFVITVAATVHLGKTLRQVFNSNSFFLEFIMKFFQLARGAFSLLRNRRDAQNVLRQQVCECNNNRK